MQRVVELLIRDDVQREDLVASLSDGVLPDRVARTVSGPRLRDIVNTAVVIPERHIPDDVRSVIHGYVRPSLRVRNDTFEVPASSIWRNTLQAARQFF